jgi:OOP family OmpA-OmpF porin
MALLAWLAIPAGLWAAEPPPFAASEAEITRALSAPAPTPVRTRGLPAPGRATRAITVMALEGGQTVTQQKLVGAEPPAAAVNLRIAFDVNSHAIRPESYRLLAELARALQGEALKTRPVTVRGHTDGDGDEAYNLALSLRRAEAVKAFLSSGPGVSPERLRVEGWGEGQPLAPNDTPQGRQLNRRVEIVAAP